MKVCLFGADHLREYRPTVDGLRTIAVFAVIAFHTGSATFAGGYLGVDIFFVISGYLITRILLDELAHGRFSLSRFYERRARRILPALSVVVLLSLGPAWLWMTPTQLENFAGSVVATALFGSNFFFWWDSSYFSESLHLKPLFHTWSLAVEEQFYIAFPLLLLWLARRRIGVIAPIAALTLTSLFLARWMSTRYPTADFYLFPTRAWELSVGALLAASERCLGGRASTTLLSLIMPAAGLVLIIWSMTFFKGTTPHPGMLTVIPVTGAALLIWFTGGHDIVSRVLASRTAVGVGLISYSLYLWHQVLFAFARLYSINALEWNDYVWLIALSVVLAYLSWLFVERPFRRKGFVPPKFIWASAGLSVILMISAGSVGYEAKGFPSRRPPIKVDPGYSNTADHDCYNVNCVVGDDVPPSIVLVGDSHAGALANSLDRTLKGTGKSALVIANGDIFVRSFPSFYKSAEMLNGRLEFQKKKIFDPQISTVILAGRFTLRIENISFDNQEGGVELLDPSYAGRSNSQKEIVIKAIEDGIRDLREAGKKIVLVYPVPEVGWNVPATLQKMTMRQIRDGLTTSYDVYMQRNRRVFELFDKEPNDGSIVRVRPDLVLCNTFVLARCATNNGTDVFYHDDDHLSIKGADLVIDRLMDRVKAQWNGFPGPR